MNAVIDHRKSQYKPKDHITVPLPCAPNEKTIQKFWSRVNKTDGCWTWTGPLNSGKYGLFFWKIRNWQAHRFIFEVTHGPIPSNKVVDHLCNNPSCVRLEHLQLLSNRENVLRGRGISAVHARKTHCIRGHEFNEQNTMWNRGKRNCKTCHRERHRRNPPSGY